MEIIKTLLLLLFFLSSFTFCFEVTTFNDYCIKCTYFGYVYCKYNIKCFSADPGYCLSPISDMVSCKTTSSTPITYTITSSNIGATSFGSQTEYVSADSYVIYVFTNSVGSALPGRVRLSYSGSSLKFYKAISTSSAKNSQLSKINTGDEITIDSGGTYYLFVSNTETSRDSFYLEY